MAGLIPFNRNNGLLADRFGFGSMFDDFFNDLIPKNFYQADTFKIDVSENDNSYVVEAELPRVQKDNIKLELCDEILTITVEKEENAEQKKVNYIHKETRYGAMQRSIRLPGSTIENAEAEYKDGLLKITLDKQSDKNKKIIDIK